MTPEPQADPAAVDALLAAGRSVAAAAAKSPGAETGEATAAQCRALQALAFRGPLRVADLAGALGVAPSSAGRMCDRMARKGLISRHRASGDRRAVLVLITAAGRRAAAEATGRRRALVSDLMGRLPSAAQRAVAEALLELAGAAGEVQASRRPRPALARAPVPRPRPPARRDGQGRPAPATGARPQERA